MSMLIERLKVERIDDDGYTVRDARRVLGGVVRWWKTVSKGRATSAVPMFRAFGQDFTTLREAVAEFAKIRGALLFDAKAGVTP